MLSLRLEPEGARIRYTPRAIAIVGFSGRDTAAVRAHIDELARHGVVAPQETPALFLVSADRLTQRPTVQVASAHTSGEAEIVLLVVEGEVLVTLGSDHTDRQLEKHDITRSKQVCPKVITSECWRLKDIDKHWDRLIVRSWAGISKPLSPYQEGLASSLLSPEDVLAFVCSKTRLLEGLAVFCGTFPLLEQSFAFGPWFVADITDPLTDRTLRLEYRTEYLGADFGAYSDQMAQPFQE